jgi:hypothetical protein
MRNGSNFLTAPERLGLLLSWLNDPTDPYSARPEELRPWLTLGRQSLSRFLASFDGSPEAGHLHVMGVLTLDRGTQVTGPVDLAPDALQTLGVELGMLLDAGFVGTNEYGSTFPMASLRFGVRNAHRTDVKLSTLTRRERRTYAGPGAFVLQVSGSQHDVVLYAVLHLLTAENMAGMLGRCMAPAARNRQARCNRWILRTGHGRRRETCDVNCRNRRASEKRAENLKKGKRR